MITLIKKIKNRLIDSGLIKIFMKDVILMESNPDFSDNSRAVFDELIKRKINEKCKIIWFVHNPKDFEDIKIRNVYFYGWDKNKFEEIRFRYYNLISKYILDCNRYINKIHEQQFRIHLCHGTPLKVASDYNSQMGKVDYLIQMSHFFDEYNAKSFCVSKEKILDLGFPRNDELYSEANKNLKLFPNIKRRKTIMWMPTYRNHKVFKNVENDIYNMQINFKYGVPTIENEEQLYKLNKVLENKQILLVIKLHPVEDSSKIQELNLSNIKLIKDSMITNEHRYLYQYLANIDALITDYSSIYYDFLLTQKPIAMVVPDKEEYRKHVKLYFEKLEENLPGEYVYSFDELIEFIIHVADGVDVSYDKRIEKIKLYHSHCDGKSAQRIVDLLIKKMMNNKLEKGKK